MLFFNFFQTLAEKGASVTIELKNDLQLTGRLHSVDQYLNFKLSNVAANDTERYHTWLVDTIACLIMPQLSVVNCFVRGSVVRYVYLNNSDVDTDELQEPCRREAMKTNSEK